MTPSQIRAELLQDHGELGSIIAATRQIAGRGSAGEPVLDELRVELARLADALRRHNVREEELLRDVMPSLGAGGQERAKIMTEEHTAEHAELFETLIGILFTPVEFAGAGVAMLLDRMLNHMAREETVFLRADGLSDEVVAIDSVDR
jgi:hypothetical protein